MKKSRLLVILIVLTLLTFRLDKVPVHLNQDELGFALNAYSIKTGLTDVSGNFLPFYFWHLGSFWATPIIVYITSLVLLFFPISESTIRISSAAIGVVSVAIMMILTKRIFKKELFAILSGLFIITTPVFFIHSRILLDNLYPIPFVLAWLLLLYIFLEKKVPGFLIFSGLSLGIGFHSYHAAKIMMPVYFLASIIFAAW